MLTFASTMKTVKYWIEAMRLRTLPVSVAGVLTAWAYAIGDSCFSMLHGILCLVFAILCQIASNFANEYYDYTAGRDHAGRQGPRRGVTEGDLTPTAMKRACFGTLAAAAVIGLSLTFRGGAWLIIVGAIIGIGALAYSAGPWPLSTHCLGEVAVLIFFGIVPVNFTYYIMSGGWSCTVFAGSAAIGLMGANVLIVNNYRDIPDDRAVGKHTLATVLGRTPVLILYLVNAVAAAALTARSMYSIGAGWLAVPAVYVLWSCMIAARMNRLEGARLNPFLGMTAVAMFLFSLSFLTAECTVL